MGNHEAAGGYPQNAGALVVLVGSEPKLPTFSLTKHRNICMITDDQMCVIIKFIKSLAQDSVTPEKLLLYCN